MIDLEALARRQFGVLTRAQCLRAGLSDDVVQARILGRRWARLERGLYVVHTGPLGYPTRVIAATLGIGGEVAACRSTALWWPDRKGLPPRQVHVAIPRRRTVAARPGVVVHHDLRRASRLATLNPPVTCVEDAVLDIAASAGTVRDVEDVVCEAVRRWLTHPERLATALRMRPRHPRRSLLTSMLAEVADGAQSPLELMDLRNDRRHGLPGERQVRHRVGGRGRWLDVEMRGAGVQRRVVKELDGRLGHEDTAGKFRDMDRDNDAALRRRVALRFGWYDEAERGCRTAAAGAAVLLGEGWTGSARACGPTCRLPAELPRLQALWGT